MEKIICQGARGSYSHIFAKSLGYEDIDFVKTFEEVVASVQNGQYKYGILPLENSTAGEVRETFDLLDNSNICYVKSGDIKISHCLLGAKGSTLQMIKTVSSHPQALMQCSKFLQEGGYKIFNEFNTAIASEKLAKENNVEHAVIASSLSSQEYGLTVLAENVQNAENNFTKFVLLSNDLQNAKDFAHNIVSVSLVLKDKPHVLGELLEIFTQYNINLTRIQSRNIPNTRFKIRFYIDFESDVFDQKTQEMLTKIASKCISLKIRGVY